jgi:hypothetical protein
MQVITETRRVQYIWYLHFVLLSSALVSELVSMFVINIW